MIYELQEPFTFKEIRADNLTEEMRIDPLNDERLVWVSQDSVLTAINVTTQVSKLDWRKLLY